jgi:hypothetical protein
MTNLVTNSAITGHVARRLGREVFTLLDVGCSGGIHPSWRVFGNRLRAIGFDPNIEEVERLRARETSSGVSYEAAFVGVPDDHPLAKLRAGRGYVGRTPWSRLSVARTMTLREEFLKRADNKALTEINAWPRAKLTSNPPVFLPEYIMTHRLGDIDFVKIDIDGGDFIVLQSVFESPAHTGILGFMLEVNFHGSDDESEHTLHNTDRLMRRMGFELFDLSIRRYSSSILPLPYEYDMPAQTLGGRPFQGDALYIRDLGAPEMSDFANGLSAGKIAKTIAVLSLGGLYDQAAEVVVRFTDRLAGLMSPEEILELLAREVQKKSEVKLSYRDYLAAFERDDPMFYPDGWHRTSAGKADSTSLLPSTRKVGSQAHSKPLLKQLKKWLKKRTAGRS